MHARQDKHNEQVALAASHRSSSPTHCLNVEAFDSSSNVPRLSLRSTGACRHADHCSATSESEIGRPEAYEGTDEVL